jgi:hypothetical protein
MKNQALPIIAGGIAGAVYFNISESGVPKDSNATYLAPISTDILAWGFGALLMWRGIVHQDPAISFVGSAVIGIHVSQFSAHKVLTNRNVNNE